MSSGAGAVDVHLDAVLVVRAGQVWGIVRRRVDEAVNVPVIGLAVRAGQVSRGLCRRRRTVQVHVVAVVILVVVRLVCGEFGQPESC